MTSGGTCIGVNTSFVYRSFATHIMSCLQSNSVFACNRGRASLRGFAKLHKFQKSELTIEVGGWVQVSLGFFWVKIRRKVVLNKY